MTSGAVLFAYILFAGLAMVSVQASDADDYSSEPSMQVSLLEEIEGSFGTGTVSKKIHKIENQLQVMFSALPKNEHGGLSHSVVRYALHRLFGRRHGWLVKGLDPAGGTFNDASPAGIFKNRSSAYIQDLFEKRLRSKGLGLHELAVFAATIEHLIHKEATQKMTQALRVHKLRPTSPLSKRDVNIVIDTYAIAYALAMNLEGITLKRANELVSEGPKLYPGWNRTRKLAHALKRNLTATMPTDETSFETLVAIALAFGEKFGRFQDRECREMKAKLVAMEDRDSGRVRLAEFYKPALNGDWQFQESVMYMRQLGSLDESDPADIRVIIPNYLGSKTNCIASSSFYSVCCINQCEALLVHIEEHIASPEAPAERIASIVANLSSSSVKAPRILPPALLQRLHSTASIESGVVPIHGRLFAQWMHHAFPRECPYPHLSGTTSDDSAGEWLESDLDPEASEEEMQKYTKAKSKKGTAEIPWSIEEELLIVRAPEATPQSSLPMWNVVRGILLFSLLLPVVVALVRVLNSSPASGTENLKGKKSFLI